MQISNAPTETSKRLPGSLAIACGAAVWGLFWIPLRYLDDNGIHGVWAVAMLVTTPLVLFLPYLLIKRRIRLTRWYIGFALSMGTSMALYFAAFIFTDVIRVVFLFYMLPVWATLISWAMFGQKIRPIQLLAIAVALTGLYFLLGGDGSIPVPKNIGDWFGLIAGFFWALSLNLIRQNPDIDPIVTTLSPYVFGAPIAIGLAFLLFFVSPSELTSIPKAGDIVSAIPFVLLIGVIIMAPSIYGQVWGARFVAAPTAALLTMTEIVFATLSAWLLIGTTLTGLGWFGGGLIILAAVLDLAQPSQEQNDLTS